MQNKTFRFYAPSGSTAWVSTVGYCPSTGDELSLPRQYFPDLYAGIGNHDTPLWEVERVVHRFDNEEYIGADVYVRKIEFCRIDRK